MTPARNERQNPSSERSKHDRPPRSPRASRSAPIIASRTSSHAVVGIRWSPMLMPLSALQGGEGGDPRGGVGDGRENSRQEGGGGGGGGAANRLVGPPHRALSPRPAGGEGKLTVGRPNMRQSFGMVEEQIEEGLIDIRKIVQVREFDPLVHLVHRQSDEAEFGDRTVGLDEARVGGASGGAELGRASGDPPDRLGKAIAEHSRHNEKR